MTLQEGKLHFCGIRGECQDSSEKWKNEILQSEIEFPDSSDKFGWINFVETSKSLTQRHLSTKLRELGYQLTNPFGGLDAVVFNELPHEYPGKSPTDGRRPPAKNKVSEMIIVGIPTLFGLQVFWYTQEKGRERVHQVCPTDEKAQSQSNEGRVKFGFHTDNAFTVTER